MGVLLASAARSKEADNAAMTESWLLHDEPSA